MAGIFRKILPVKSSTHHDVIHDDDYDVDYSFAMEYNGPPVSYNIPQLIPVNINYIPTASPVVSTSLLNKSPLPIIQPIEKRGNLVKKLKIDSNSASNASGDVYSGELEDSSASESLNVNDSSCELILTIDDEFEIFSKPIEDIFTETSTSSQSKLSENYISKEDSENEKSEIREEKLQMDTNLVPKAAKDLYSDEFVNSCSPELLNGDDNMPRESFTVIENSSELNMSIGDKFEDCSNSIEEVSSDFSMSSQSMLSEKSKSNDDYVNQNLAHVKFRDPESSNIVKDESNHNQAATVLIRQPPERKGKKGSCYRCSKGNRFTEKETCIVCNAKYCANCVLRVMGSMPEGRKCIPCIGEPINELMRGTLGKDSRLLTRLLTRSGAKQIMSLELLSKVNQLRPDLVFVNEKNLRQEEIDILQSCSNPPKKLRPGHYWYDKESGLWGKEGQKPCQIISPHLNIGGSIKQNASNGNTNVLVNNREITKVELFMLQLAGVECEGHPRFWMNAKGSLVEEGMKKERGGVWDKATMRLLCAALSLPLPSEIGNSKEEVNNNSEEKSLHKLLLVGFSKSGTSTIYKQTKIRYKVPFTEDELQDIKFVIQSNLYEYLGILLEGHQRFEEEITNELIRRQPIDQSGPSENADQNDTKKSYSIGPRLKEFSDWFLNVMKSSNLHLYFPAATREYAPVVEELWKNPAIQATYQRRSELISLPSVASYFLSQAVEVSRPGYEPTNKDILFAEGITSSNRLSCVEFSFPKSEYYDCMEPAYHHTPSTRYQLVRVHPKTLGGNCKWLDMFEDARIVLFCVDLTDYDQFSENGNGNFINKMMETKKFFESIVTHPSFYKKNFCLILNKLDLLEEKIEKSPLTKCEWFSDFNPLFTHPLNSNHHNTNNPSLAHRAFQYIAVKFKKLYKSLHRGDNENKLYVSAVTALDPDTVDAALRYAREILKWNEEKHNFSLNEHSSYSIEGNSSYSIEASSS